MSDQHAEAGGGPIGPDRASPSPPPTFHVDPPPAPLMAINEAFGFPPPNSPADSAGGPPQPPTVPSQPIHTTSETSLAGTILQPASLLADHAGSVPVLADEANHLIGHTGHFDWWLL